MRWILLLFALAGCQPIGDQVVTDYDDWLRSTSFTTQEREIYRGADGIGIVTARPVIVMSPDGTGYAVLTNVRRRDVNGPRIDRITSQGVTLDYRRHDRLFTHCIDGCQRAEIGAIVLSRDAFTLAARTGLPLRIWGQRGRYEGTVPAEAFARVLTEAGADG